MSKSEYVRFTDYPNITLQYASCHDGHTLWDKINLTTKGDKIEKFESVRQSILLQITLQGRLMFLAGSEMLYSKPNDKSGQDGDRCHFSDNAIDLFNLGKEYNENTYKTTDWSNGMRWEQLDGEIKIYIADFMKKALHFRTDTHFFNLSTTTEINNFIIFNYISKEQGIIDFSIRLEDSSIRVIHNFKSEIYTFKADDYSIFIDSKIGKSKTGEVSANSSQILLKQGE